MLYKISLDLGSTSIGWCLFKLSNNQPSGVLSLGVRIYDDGREAKSKEPTAVTRRLARGARRNRDRKKGRVNRLRHELSAVGLFPKELADQKKLEHCNPYEIRTRALDQEIAPFELGRALLHIAQRRGFKSNRKSDKGSNESGPVKNAAAKLSQQILSAGARTLGEYLNTQDTKRVRRFGGEYTVYPIRQMYEEEVEKILSVQKKYHSNLLTPEICTLIRHIIFYQRDLHKPKIGFCTFEYEAHKHRAPLALPLVQEFRIHQEVNNLDLERYTHEDASLSHEQRTSIISALNQKSKVTFKAMRKQLGLSASQTFNLEHDARSELKGNDTSAKLSNDKAFGSSWFDFSLAEQTTIVEKLLNEENEAALINWLQTKYSLTEETGHYIAGINLVDGYGRLSVEAIEKILPHLKDGYKYHDACLKAGYHHSDFRTGEILEKLPYYGEVLSHRVIGGSYEKEDEKNPELFYGKVNNPTVHIVMNQLRKLINACIDKWGLPAEISVELARDLKVPAKDQQKLNGENQRDNQRIEKELEKIGIKNSYANRMRYKLWEDAATDPEARCCPFTGVIIGSHEIFSPEFEEEHLIPFSRSFDNGRANKVLALRSANRAKGNRTPFEAFGHSPIITGQLYNWPTIQAHADKLGNKRWRFRPDAMEIFEKKDGLLARQLNDTRYLSRLAKEYLQSICDPNKIQTSPGQLTALLRRKWGLESEIWDEGIKNRADHRHHAIDAFVVGCTTRAMLQKISTAAGKLENDQARQDKRHKIIDNMPEPFPDYLQTVKSHFEKLIISHKPDRGNAAKAVVAPVPYSVAKLHEDTAYSLVQQASSPGKSIYVTSKSIDSMVKKSDIEAIRDDHIRTEFLAAIDGLKDASKEFTTALLNSANARKNPVRHARVLVEKSDAVMIPVKDKKTGKAYKYYQGGGNAYTEIFISPKSKKPMEWQAETISQYQAHSPSSGRQWRKADPTAKLVMRLHMNDMVAYEKDGKTIIARVKKMTGGRVYLRPHNIAQEEADKSSWGAFARGMQLASLRKISVDILGNLRDPGPKK